MVPSRTGKILTKRRGTRPGKPYKTCQVFRNFCLALRYMLRLRHPIDGSIAVLREIRGVLQDDPSSERRWYHDDYFDLFVRETGEELLAFELCYSIHSDERALVWRRDQGYFHDGGTSGPEDFIGARLAAGDPLEADPIISRFELAAGQLP